MALVTPTALDMLASPDLIGLGMEADALRRKLHPQNTVTYVLLAQPASAVDDGSSLRRSAEDVAECGAVDLLLPAPALSPALYRNPEAELRPIKEQFPELALHGPGAGQILACSTQNSIALPELLRRLRDAGLQSIGPDTDDTIYSSGDLLHVHRAAHQLGLPSAASLVIGRGETNETRLLELEAIGRVQEETDGFHSFELRVHHPATPQARREEEATAVDYLKTLAVARLLLASIPHIQTGWTVQGPKVLELALRFGADDAGPIPPRRSSPKEPAHHGGEGELRRIIRDAGFTPVLRDLRYTRSFLHG